MMASNYERTTNYAIDFMDSGIHRSLIGIVKASIETKKLIDEKIMPDIKTDDKVEEIVRKQELAKSLVAFTGIEAAYYTARGLVIALNFALIMHYAFKFAARVSPRDKDQD